mgnify:FL=1
MKFPLATGIAIFAYNRPSHLKRVLIALEDYKINNATIFVDGPKSKRDRICQEEILFMIKTNKNIKFTIIQSKKNKGLSRSLISGISYMSMKFKQVIVLEDDCIPRAEFFPFVSKSLRKFKNDDKVLGVCGYQLPELHEKKNMKINAILLKNFISWGWAIWSNKWLNYIKDYKKYYKQSKKKSKISKLIEKKYINNKNYWTPNFIDYAFQTASTFVFPNKSLIKNIGFDGTGVNSKTSFDFNTYYTRSKYLNINNRITVNKNLNSKQEKILLKKLHLFY